MKRLDCVGPWSVIRKYRINTLVPQNFHAVIRTHLSSLENWVGGLIMTYYFDILPLHPGPEHLESLTSYLMLLAELNGISSIDGISSPNFPQQDRRITRDMADYPPVSFSKLMIVGAFNEETLRMTTFFHVDAMLCLNTQHIPNPQIAFYLDVLVSTCAIVQIA